MATMDIIKLNGGQPANFLGMEMKKIPRASKALLSCLLADSFLFRRRRWRHSSSHQGSIPAHHQRSQGEYCLETGFGEMHVANVGFFSQVTAIFVNIFGGIVRCDAIAQGLISVVKSMNLRIPIVARLQGTNMEEAHQLVCPSSLSL